MVVRVRGDRVYLLTPYHEDLPPRARALSGTWDPQEKRWVFPARDEQRVRDLAREVFGDDCTYRAAVHARQRGPNPLSSGPGVELGHLTRAQAEEFVRENVKRFQEADYDIREAVIRKER